MLASMPLSPANALETHRSSDLIVKDWGQYVPGNVECARKFGAMASFSRVVRSITDQVLLALPRFPEPKVV